MSVAFLYVFLALVLQDNSIESVLGPVGGKKSPSIYGRWCVVKYHKQFCLNISS